MSIHWGGRGVGHFSRNSAPGFNPYSLYASGAQGFWLDPFDFSTMFQDRAGTTPVTAAGQVTGMVLDKSKGLALGPELVTNGGFDSDTAWTKGAGWSISDGVATFAGGANANISQSLTLVIGKTYRVTFTIPNTVSGFVAVYLGSGGRQSLVLP